MNTQKKVSISPFVSPNAGPYDNLGLARYGLNIAEGVEHKISMQALRTAEGLKYVTGLDPFAKSVLSLPTEEREAKEKQIKETVIHLTKLIDYITIDENDPDWFSKIKTLRPTNKEFWSSEDFNIRLSTYDLRLDFKNPKDIIKYYSIKGGGYPEIAYSYEYAIENPRFKFYLNEEADTIAVKIELSKLIVKASSQLQQMLDKNINKLFYISKLVSASGLSVTKSTSHDVMFEICINAINGGNDNASKRKAVQNFLEYSKKEISELKLEAILKDAISLFKIEKRADDFYYIKLSNEKLGKTTKQIIEKLKDPLIEPSVTELIAEVEKYWNK